MNIAKKLPALLLAAVMAIELALPALPLFGLLLSPGIHAAPDVEIRVARDDSGALITANTVTLEWDRVIGANEYIITWMDLTGERSVTVPQPASGNCVQLIDMLSPDTVYTFDMEARDGLGVVIASGRKKVLTQVTFGAEHLAQSAIDVPPEGKEVGVNPGFLLKWRIPQVITGPGTTVNYASIGGNTTPDFTIYVGVTRDADENAPLCVSYDEEEGVYKVTRFDLEGPIVSETVYYDTPGGFEGYIGFEIDNTTYPELTPGTIYYMQIQPEFNPSEGVQFKKSPLDGGYTYTPLRFHMTRDSYDNLIITAYKVNQSLRTEIANFTYEVQSDTDSQFFNYITEARESSEFSQGDEPIVIFLGGKAPGAVYYYRVIAWAPAAGEELMSPYIQYAISEVSARAPMPEGLQVVEVNPLTGTVEGFDVKSAAVKLRWKKPANYNNLKQEREVYYHILLNTAQFDMKKPNGVTYEQEVINVSADPSNPDYESFDIKYREVLKINIAHSDIKTSGISDTLEYEMDGLQLFKVFDVDPDTGEDIAPPEDLPNIDGYPNRLLANKVYFIKMYATREEDRSDTCVAQSFTTPPDVLKIPPVPREFRLAENGNGIDVSGKNFINLEWNKVFINISDYTSRQTVGYRVYYDLYISSTPDDEDFILAGTSQMPGDVVFIGDSNPNATIVTANISSFTPGTEPYERFGSRLKPNTPYYFKVRCRLAISGEPEERLSPFSHLVAVTTQRPPVVEPGEEDRKPLAIVDFSIDQDEQNNLVVDSNSVRLTWTRLETDVRYTLIRTEVRIDSTADIDDLRSDVNYGLREYILPSNPGSGNYTFDSGEQRYRFLVEDLLPNRVYYFSLRAERVIYQGQPNETVLASVWVTVPVTTTIIQPPELPEVMQDVQIGISWLADKIFAAEDFSVAISNRAGTDFRVLMKHEIAITEEELEGLSINRFYGRITGLQPNSSYYIRVTGTTTDAQGQPLVHPQTNFGPLTTRNKYYEIELKWIGKANSSYGFAIKSENDVNYTDLLPSDYIIGYEKDRATVGTGSSRYYARIGAIQGTPLKSGTKYFVRIRTYRENSDGSIDYSKYIGPVTARTDFRQEDYDDEQRDADEEAEYEAGIEKIRKSAEWKLLDGISGYEIITRSTVVSEMILAGTSAEGYTIDLENSKYSSVSRRGAYVPVSVIEKLNAAGKNLSVRVPGAEFILRPQVINTHDLAEITYFDGEAGVKEVFLYIEAMRADPAGRRIPSGTSLVSDIYLVRIKAVGMRKSGKTIDDEIDARLTLLAQTHINQLRHADEIRKDTVQELRELIGGIMRDITSRLADYSYNLIYEEIPECIVDARSIHVLSGPLKCRLKCEAGGGYKSGYLYTESGNKWQKVDGTVIEATNEAVFETRNVSGYAVLAVSAPAGGYAFDSHWAKKDIVYFINRIDVSDIYGNVQNINPDLKVSVKEAVKLAEKAVRRKTGEYKEVDVAEIARDMGMGDTINTGAPDKNLTREEMAGLVVRIYCVRAGISEKNFRPGRIVNIEDEADIAGRYYRDVLIAIDLGLMSTDSEGYFHPQRSVSRAEAFVIFNRLMDMFN